MPRVLALDFDGVISDSLLEAYLITRRIAGDFDPDLAPENSKYLPTLDSIRSFRYSNPEHWKSFAALVPFSNRCEDYLLCQMAAHQSRRITSQEQFNTFARRLTREEIDSFHDAFYAERYRLAGLDREKWLSLNSCYPGVPEVLRKLAGRFTLAVVTSKDRRSVGILLKHYGVAEIFDNVLDKSMGASKRAHLTELSERCGIPYENITFIDDKVAHLIDCAPLGIHPLLAGWGYNSDQERELACKHSIKVLELEELAFI
ncbi:MAG: HAD hydrolase-like protein [Gemmatimonadota bacterium]|nr:HAD hydrolase-like protein [Gemmatimonadota bacterium]